MLKSRTGDGPTEVFLDFLQFFLNTGIVPQIRWRQFLPHAIIRCCIILANESVVKQTKGDACSFTQ
jgi:hypothetical protein